MIRKTGHMNFDDITKLINGRPGIRFNRVAWGSDLWMEYHPILALSLIWKGARTGCAKGIGGKDKRDWRILPDLQTGEVPKL